MHIFKNVLLVLSGCLAFYTSMAQVTFPVNGVADQRTDCFAFTNAVIVKDAQVTVNNATLVIRKGKIVAVGQRVSIPADAVVIDCQGKYIYPSFIDLYSEYGIPVPQRSGAGFSYTAPLQLTSNTKGAFGWNQAIRPETDAVTKFSADETRAKQLRDIGFGIVLTHQKDGIARGTGALVSLKNTLENLGVIKEKAAAHFSFSKGTSTQAYPTSLMGSIALLRQTFLDGEWYKQKPVAEGLNLSLQAWNDNLKLPAIFEVADKWNALRADRIGDEFGKQFILKAGGDEYQRIREIQATNAAFILPLNFPQAMDVEDPNDARFVSLQTLKHWEMAPTNPAAFEKNNIPFCLTPSDLREAKQFPVNLRKAIEFGLSESKALEALTKTPATLLDVFHLTGSIDEGKLANFLITDGPVFGEKTNILQNWVQGQKHVVKEDIAGKAGTYSLVVQSTTGSSTYSLEIKNNNTASLIGNDTLAIKYKSNGKLVNMSFSPVAKSKKKTGEIENISRDTARFVPQGMPPKSDSAIAITPDDQLPPKSNVQLPAAKAAPVSNDLKGPLIRLSGVDNGVVLQGNGVDTSGNPVTWSAKFVQSKTETRDSSKKKPLPVVGKLAFPNMAFGWDELPRQETIIIKHATVWTSDAKGILANADVLIRAGKIVAVGPGLNDPSARIIDAKGKHVTPGIIDEHSHIAAASINEGGQSVTSEVRISDNIAPDDINIYRQLSGGVTTSHILHGSANAIGGQTQLIKLRWGVNDTALKFKGADGFIKFALGENVKKTPTPNNNRFPDTRMGVAELQTDAFTRAREYEKTLRSPNSKVVRRDLELDALVEIMNGKRFITCHSYVQSEIVQTLRMAELFGFKINTFTHILEGYKVADKMKAHGSNVSTFSDWWAYKVEVQDAIPYNAAIMQAVGLNVAINSDDPEMARRLNQEAAKSIKYGKMNEEDALKMVTINPAKMLHVDKLVGSIAVGKDADVVIWSDNPLSIYAKVETTIVDGIIYFDRERDKQLRLRLTAERNRIIQKMLEEKRSGNSVSPARPSTRAVNYCEDHQHDHGILDDDTTEASGY